MTHTYVAKRLLEHGPLTLREFADITGWGYESAQAALKRLLETGIAKRTHAPGARRYAYALA